MTREIDELPGQKRKQSVKDYASKVLKESSVSAVSAIVSTGNIRRKVFRVLVFLIFTIGFLYNCIEFLLYFWQFPTVVNIEMVRPDKYLRPAYTFCNFNPIIRSKFCSKYPDRCNEAGEEFCKKYTKYCVENNTKVPKDDIEFTINPKEIMGLVHDHNKLLKFVSGKSEEPEGPLPREDSYGYGTAACYSMYGRIDSPLEPEYIHRHSWIKYADWLKFDPMEGDVLYPSSDPGIVFSIHSPFEAVNPFVQGIFLKPGHIYQIFVEMVAEESLPYPYKTDCLNYTETWLHDNKTGPRSQEMCRHRCIKEFEENCLQCVETIVLYPSPISNLCNYDHKLPNPDHEICKNYRQYLTSCFSKCKKDCIRMKYSYQVQELLRKRYEKENETSFLSWIEVRINFGEAEIMKIQNKPQYQSVEVFSYIGGFIGIWLGVSLVQVADVFESFFLIARYFFKKGSVVCSTKSNSEVRSGST